MADCCVGLEAAAVRRNAATKIVAAQKPSKKRRPRNFDRSEDLIGEPLSGI